MCLRVRPVVLVKYAVTTAAAVAAGRVDLGKRATHSAFACPRAHPAAQARFVGTMAAAAAAGRVDLG